MMMMTALWSVEHLLELSLLKTLTSCTFATTLEEDFITSTHQMKHFAQGSTACKRTTQNLNWLTTQNLFWLERLCF